MFTKTSTKLTRRIRCTWVYTFTRSMVKYFQRGTFRKGLILRCCRWSGTMIVLFLTEVPRISQVETERGSTNRRIVEPAKSLVAVCVCNRRPAPLATEPLPKRSDTRPTYPTYAALYGFLLVGDTFAREPTFSKIDCRLLYSPVTATLVAVCTGYALFVCLSYLYAARMMLDFCSYL